MSKWPVSIMVDRVMVSEQAWLAVNEFHLLGPARDINPYSEHFWISR